MRTVTVEAVSGRVSSTGVATNGPCSVQRVSAGKYNLFPPPGKRIVGVNATPFAPAQWLMSKCDEVSGRAAQITFATTAATETDTGFVYTAVLAA